MSSEALIMSCFPVLQIAERGLAMVRTSWDVDRLDAIAWLDGAPFCKRLEICGARFPSDVAKAPQSFPRLSAPRSRQVSRAVFNALMADVREMGILSSEPLVIGSTTSHARFDIAVRIEAQAPIRYFRLAFSPARGEPLNDVLERIYDEGPDFNRPMAGRYQPPAVRWRRGFRSRPAG